MWLMGYNEKGMPLTDEEMKEDVMPEYRNKTCTIETQPQTGLRNISVHPCRHSLLLQKMIKDFQNAGKKLEIEQSIILFLKLSSSIIPIIKIRIAETIANTYLPSAFTIIIARNPEMDDGTNISEAIKISLYNALIHLFSFRMTYPNDVNIIKL